MTDDAVHATINRLSREEQELYQDAAAGPLAPAELRRLRAIRLELDQAWDLLHQREALRNVGLDPEGARPRPVAVVEGYEQ